MDLAFWNNKLSDKRMFIHGEEFEESELNVFKRIQEFKDEILKFNKTFSRLNQYLETMQNLTAWK